MTMSVYSTPIIVAIIILFMIGFFTAVPWMIYNYRKYGFLSFWKTLVAFSFVFYALSAYFLVILPLPEVRDTCAMQAAGTQYFQLMPFDFIFEILRGSHVVWSNPATYINFVKHSAFLPAFLNIFILLPLGVYMRYFRGETMTVKRMFLTGFSVSLFFEITQVTGLYGIYTCPYRLFDVDDLILNTTGSVIGFLIAPAILALFPSEEQVLEKSSRVFKESVVRPLPQLLAIVIDYIVVAIAWFVVAPVFKVYDPMTHVIFITIGMFVLQFLIPLLMNGRTLGSRLLRFRLEKVGSDKGRLTAFLKRWFAFMAPWLMYQLFSLVAQYATLDMDSHYYAFNVWMQVILMLLMFVIIFVLCVHILIVLFIRKRHYFYFDDLAGIRARYEQHK